MNGVMFSRPKAGSYRIDVYVFTLCAAFKILSVRTGLINAGQKVASASNVMNSRDGFTCHGLLCKIAMNGVLEENVFLNTSLNCY